PVAPPAAAANRRAVASPMPLAAPVITATLLLTLAIFVPVVLVVVTLFAAGSAEQRIGVLDQFTQCLEEGRPHRAIDHPMVAGHGDRHHRAETHRPVVQFATFAAQCTHRQNAALG